MSESPLTTLKIIIMGSVSVGKTSILRQLVIREFVHSKPTIAPDLFHKIYQYKGEKIQLALWDTAGTERHDAVPSIFYRDVQGVVFVYDVTNYKSFMDLHKWMLKLEENYESLEKRPVITILGNKIDMEMREVQRQEGQHFAKNYRALFLETSAKTNEGVETAFDDVIAKIMETPGLWKKNQNYDVVNLQQNSSNQDAWYKNCVQCWF